MANSVPMVEISKFPLPKLLQNGKNSKDVMLNLFQHLIKTMGYETLKQVQGDRM
jgi:hypothetical protein